MTISVTKSAKIILLGGCTLFLFGSIFLQPASFAQQQATTANQVTTTSADSISPYPEYETALKTLRDEFRQEGFTVAPLLEDSRFKIYKTIDERFLGSAERTTPTLDEYKEILDFEEKVIQGVQFLDEHSAQLQKAENKYDISRYIITAIIGIESKYGDVLGSYNPFNVYISMMMVDYRADFAKAQLKELLEFVNRKNIDVFTLKSSYAGAMSPAQFIPYSVNKWWVGSDILDMNNSILSVANYLAYFKERTGDLRTSVLRYNPSGLYADTILDLAAEIEKKSK